MGQLVDQMNCDAFELDVEVRRQAEAAQRYVVVALDGVKRCELSQAIEDGIAADVAGVEDDIDAFDLHMKTSWPTDLLSQGKLSELSLYRELRRLADGYPDPKTGQMTAISSALNVKFTQVYIAHPPQQTVTSSHAVRAALQSSR